MIVAIDAGNTRTKWGVLNETGELLAQGAVDNADLDRLASVAGQWQGCRRMVVSNVAGEAMAAQLAVLSRQCQLPLLMAVSAPAACGVTNLYAHPGQLGVDRWLALVAAWNRGHAPCVVATAGTALTVDALSSQGEFLGGLIVPGLRLMQASLATGTAGLPVQAGQFQALPRETGDAIYSGVLMAMAGAVERMRQTLQAREGRAPRCLLSGGDAPLLEAALPGYVEIADNLVLHGLWLIEKEHA